MSSEKDLVDRLCSCLDRPRRPWTCLLCGRDRFTRPGQPHICGGQYRKNFKKAARLAGMSNCWKETEIPKEVRKLP